MHALWMEGGGTSGLSEPLSAAERSLGEFPLVIPLHRRALSAQQHRNDEIIKRDELRRQELWHG